MQPPPALDTAGVLNPEALASTYKTPGQLRPWDAVEQYHRVMRVASRNPNKGSAALASTVELPRSRIRTWVDNGGAPDVVRALDIASELDWFEDSIEITTAWATLVAGILGGGSIATEFHRPQWTQTPALARERVIAALDTLGVGVRVVEREGRPVQLQPDDHPTIVGRALVALGAPVGDKNDRSVIEIPKWLRTADDQSRRAAVELLVLYRGHGSSEKDTVQLFETRSRTFRQSVAALIESVADGNVNPGSRYVIISAATARELGFGRGGPFRSAIEER